MNKTTRQRLSLIFIQSASITLMVLLLIFSILIFPIGFLKLINAIILLLSVLRFILMKKLGYKFSIFYCILTMMYALNFILLFR